jgi:hypothetical protein
VQLVTITCTDRGQHPEVTLCRLLDGRDVGRGDSLLARGGLPLTDWRPADGSRTLRFRCRRCSPRDVRLREMSILLAVDALRAEHPGSPVVIDVSLLS